MTPKTPPKGTPTSNWGAPPPTSPWIWQDTDINGHTARLIVDFDAALTGAILGMTTERDEACEIRTFLIGIGPDGTPDSSPAKISIPSGSNLVSAVLLGVLSNLGIGTYAQLQTQQITSTTREF